MNAQLLADISTLFSIESLKADKEGRTAEGDRLWAISEKIFERAITAGNLTHVRRRISPR